MTEHLYCQRYGLTHNQFLDEPTEAVEWRLRVAGVIDERSRPKER